MRLCVCGCAPERLTGSGSRAYGQWPRATEGRFLVPDRGGRRVVRAPGDGDAHEGAGAKARLSEQGEVVRSGGPGRIPVSGEAVDLRCTCSVPDTHVSRGAGGFWRFQSGRRC